jgi:pyrroline-5-carboxylate reductase
MFKLGIIGCGNMGGAMLRQMLKAGLFTPEEVIVSDKNPSLRAQLKSELGVNVTYRNEEAAAATTLLLAVKPQFVREVGAEIAGAVNPSALIISIVAGYDLAMLHALLQSDAAHIIRVMPNTPAMVGEGVLAACRGQHVTDEEWKLGMKLLSCMGMAEEVTENLMDAVTGLSGSSPAFVFLFLEALSDAGVRGGLPRVTAQRFAAQTLLGSAKLALETGKHPGQLKDMVTSPAGTTIEGVAALERNAFRSAVMEAVDAAIQKSKSFHQEPVKK